MKMTEHLFPSIIHQEVEIKDFNVLIDEKTFFNVSIKNKEETYEKIIEMSKIMIIQLVIYWIMNIFQSIIN